MDGDLIEAYTVGDLKLEARRGSKSRPLTIWQNNFEVGSFPASELHNTVPTARLRPVFLRQIIGITPWPGREIQARAVAAWRRAEGIPNVRTCEG